jgi:predicted aconitase
MVAHFHIVGVTPEAPSEKHACGLKKLGYSDTISFDARDRSKTEESLSSAAPEEADIVVLGCPHASILQIRRYATLLSGRKKSNNVEIWIQVSHTIKSYADDIGLTGVVESSGARLISNTCIVVMPRDFLSIRF